MRIAIATHGIFPYELGGMERHTTFLANYLVDSGAEVDVLTPAVTGKKSVSDTIELKFNLIEIDWPNCKPWLRANYKFSENVATELKKKAYQAIYCQGFSAWAYLKQTYGQQRPLTIFNPHGLEMFKTHSIVQTLKHWPMRFAARQQAKLADVTVSLGGKLTEQVLKFLPTANNNVVEIPNAIDTRYIDAMRPQAKQKKANQFVFVGRLAQNKGVDLLCQAFRDSPQANLVIVGGGPLEAELKSNFDRCKNIQFAGRIDDAELFTLYAESDCFIFSSLYEGMPTVILEAMCCELPVVATDIGAVTTMVKDSTGFVIRPGSVEELKRGIALFTGLDAARKREYGQAARQWVTSNFTWEIIAKKTLETVQSRRSSG